MGYKSKFTGSQVDSLLTQIDEGGLITVDDQLSETSENAIMNKTVATEIDNIMKMFGEKDFSTEFSNDFC